MESNSKRDIPLNVVFIEALNKAGVIIKDKHISYALEILCAIADARVAEAKFEIAGELKKMSDK